MGRAYKARIATATAAALRNHDFLTVLTQVAYELAGIRFAHNGPYRHTQNDIIGTATMLLCPGAMVPTLPFVVGLITEVDEGTQAFVGT